MRCNDCAGSFPVADLASIGSRPTIRYYCFKCYMKGGLR